MKVRELVRKLLIPLACLCVVFVATTFAAPFMKDASGGAGWLISRMDLRQEGNQATWFSGALYLVCGVSFAPLVFAGKGVKGLSRFFRAFFLLCALGCVFVSADEITSIHERVGRKIEHKTGLLAGSEIQGHGFSWLLVYGPAGLAALGVMTWALGRLIGEASVGRKRRWAFLMLTAVVVSVVGTLLCESAEAYLKWSGCGAPWGLLSCFEEAFELAAALCLAACNAALAEAHDL